MKTALAIIMFLSLGLPGLTSFYLQPTTFRVGTSADLQNAINAAQPGDTIISDAGATLPGAFEFPARSCAGPSDVVTWRSSKLDSIPKLRPDTIPDTTNFTKTVSIVQGTQVPPVWKFLGDSKCWNISGIEVTTVPGQPYANVLIDIGTYVPKAHVPSNINFDRVYIHQLEDGTDNAHGSSRIGVAVNAHDIKFTYSRLAMPAGYEGASKTVSNQYAWLSESGSQISYVDCYFGFWYNAFMLGGASMPTDNFATILPGATMNQATLSNVNNMSVGNLVALQQKVCVTDANGNCAGGYYGTVKISAINTATKTIQYTPYSGNWPGQGTPLNGPPLSGGDAQWNGYLPKDISLIHCTFDINQKIAEQILAENNNQTFPKGEFEVKAVDGFFMDGCRFINFPSNLAFTNRNQGTPKGAPSPWNTIDHVTIQNSRYSPSKDSPLRPLIILLEDNYASSTPGGNFAVLNNLWQRVGQVVDVAGGSGVSILGNTFDAPADRANSMVNNTGLATVGLNYSNNIAANNEYGMHCTTGDMACFPSSTMAGNVIVGQPQLYRPTCGAPYPVGNKCTDNFSDLKFTDPANGDYTLKPDSPFKGMNAGKDPGVDMVMLRAAQGGNSPIVPSPSPTPTLSPSPSPVPTPVPSPPTTGIQIITATYGGNVGASQGNVTADIASHCNGFQECPYVIDYTAIGDPVPGKEKAYTVQYRCVNSPSQTITVPPEAGRGTKIVLSCLTQPSPSPSPIPSPTVVPSPSPSPTPRTITCAMKTSSTGLTWTCDGGCGLIWTINGGFKLVCP